MNRAVFYCKHCTQSPVTSSAIVGTQINPGTN